MKVKTIGVDERKARDAFDVHAALLKAERDDPSLKANPHWTIIRQDAFEAFSGAFKVLT
jgi:hypothetical protein